MMPHDAESSDALLRENAALRRRVEALLHAGELRQAEIARLTTDLAGRDRALTQAHAATDAERAARRTAEADTAAYRRVIDALSRAGDIASVRGAGACGADDDPSRRGAVG